MAADAVFLHETLSGRHVGRLRRWVLLVFPIAGNERQGNGQYRD
jgi:hypothetical protein